MMTYIQRRGEVQRIWHHPYATTTCSVYITNSATQLRLITTTNYHTVHTHTHTQIQTRCDCGGVCTASNKTFLNITSTSQLCSVCTSFSSLFVWSSVDTQITHHTSRILITTSMRADFVLDDRQLRCQTSVQWSDIRFNCAEPSLASLAWSAVPVPW